MSVVRLTEDAEAIVLTCTSIGLERRAGGPKPLTLGEWNDLSRRMRGDGLPSPGAMLGLTAGDLARDLEIDPDHAERVAALLDRGGQFAVEMESLSARGIWLITRIDEQYPSRLRRRLNAGAPPVLFGAGEPQLLEMPGVAVVGSRDISDQGSAFTDALARVVVRSGRTIVSGAARGVDSTAMNAALEARGAVSGVLADSLQRAVSKRALREPLTEGHLVLVSPYHPGAPFSVGTAMGRNRLIYCLSDVAVVVESSLSSGGTRAGALENLKAGWVPVLVRESDDASEGNRDLIDRGAGPIRSDDLDDVDRLVEVLDSAPPPTPDEPQQQSLFQVPAEP